MALLNELLSRTNLTRAYNQVVRNQGSAGTDRMQVNELKTYLQKHWGEIRLEIEQGIYLPKPIRGIEIPKRSGGKRLLGIPTVLDRMIQQSVHQVLSPLWEPEFSSYSYGFRPGRNAQQAVQQAQTYINEGYQVIIDIDLQNFFDVVNQDYLMSLLNRTVSDRMVLKLIRKYPQAGILVGSQIQERKTGTPQGSPLSPLLSNILLNELDKELGRRGLRFVRYADDCSIYLNSKRAAWRVKRSITKFIEAKLKLKVNQKKTGIRRPVSFKLLGYAFVSTFKKGEYGKYNLRVNPTRFDHLKDRIRQITRKTSPMTFDERIGELNSLTRGWVNYFKLATMWGKLHELDGWIRNRLRYCIWKQWKRPNRRRRAFIQLGVDPGHAFAWAYCRHCGWRIAQSPIMGTTITLDRLKQRGYISFEETNSKVGYV